MKENDILANLDGSADTGVKLKTIEYLRSISSVHLPISNIPLLFKRVRGLLQDQSNTVVYSTITWLIEAKDNLFRPDIFPEYIRSVVPNLIQALGHAKHAIRKSTLSLLKLSIVNSADYILAELVKGMEDEHLFVRKGCVESVVALMDPQNYDASADIKIVLPALVGRLRDVSASVIQSSAQALGFLRSQYNKQLIAELTQLSEGLRRLYSLYEDRLDDDYLLGAGLDDYPTVPGSKMSTRGTFKSGPVVHLEFGFVSSKIVDKCNNEHDVKVRAAGIETIQRILADLDTADIINPYLNDFLTFMKSFIMDDDYKIALVALNIIDDLVAKSRQSAKLIIDILGEELVIRLHDGKTIIRQYVMRIFNSLMHILSSKPVVSLAISHLSDKSSRMREESINLMISAVLQYPDAFHDFEFMVQTLSVLLHDPHSRVRYVALEALAVFLNMSPDMIKIIPKDQQAQLEIRLATKQLPELTIDGLVQHLEPRKRSSSAKPTRRNSSPLDEANDAGIPNYMPLKPAEIMSPPPQRSPQKAKDAFKLPPIQKTNSLSNDASRYAPFVEQTSLNQAVVDFDPRPIERKAMPLSLATRKRLDAKRDSAAPKTGEMDMEPIGQILDELPSWSESKPRSSRASPAPSLPSPPADSFYQTNAPPQPLFSNGHRVRSETLDVSSVQLSDSPTRRKTVGKKILSSQIIDSPAKNRTSAAANLKLDGLDGFSLDGQLKAALDSIQKAEWEAKVAGLEHLAVILGNHTPFSGPYLHEITVTVAAEILNLRSQVSRVALTALTGLYGAAGKNLVVGGNELDITVTALFKKAGESLLREKFLVQDIDDTLLALQLNQGLISPAKVLPCILNSADHKNGMVRTKVAQHIQMLFMAPEVSKQLLSKIGNNVVEVVRLFTILSRFSNEGLVETRNSAKATILFIFANFPQWLTVNVERQMNPRDLNCLKSVLESVESPLSRSKTLSRKSLRNK